MLVKELFESRIDESVGFVMFAEYLREAGLGPWQATLVYLFAVGSPIIAFLGFMNFDSIKTAAKNALADYKAKKELTPADINKLKAQAEEALSKMPKGKATWLKTLMKRLDVQDKSELLAAKREVQDYLKKQESGK